jgi:hypothetical protein
MLSAFAVILIPQSREKNLRSSFAQGKLREASLPFAGACRRQKATGEILRPDKSGLRMTEGSNFEIRVQ